MIENLGWISTVLVLLGYILNSNEKPRHAMIAWIIGDTGWIVYDYLINNFSHLTLSAVIIAINVYGIYRLKIKE